jgi:hypothetical protein
MPFSTTILFYLLIGAATAVAVFVSENSSRSRGVQSLMAVFFWPILLPMLLSSPAQNRDEPLASRMQTSSRPVSNDSMSAAISQVETELDGALQSLDGWSEGMLTREAERICELKSAWGVQAGRIRELDRLLTQPGFAAMPESTAMPDLTTEEPVPPLDERILAADRTRQANIRRLREMRRQMHSDLMGTLAWVRELVTMIHLAKYGGAPASRAEELVAQIAAAVEGLSEVTAWSPDEDVRVDATNRVAV